MEMQSIFFIFFIFHLSVGVLGSTIFSYIPQGSIVYRTDACPTDFTEVDTGSFGLYIKKKKKLTFLNNAHPPPPFIHTKI